MLIVNPLPPEEIETLEDMHKNHPCHAPRIKAHAILLSDAEFKLSMIASVYGVCRQTAATWLHAWEDGGISVHCLISHGVVVLVFCPEKQKLKLSYR